MYLDVQCHQNTLNLLHEVAECVVLLHNKIYLSKIFCRDTSFTKVCITIYMKNKNAICKNFPEKSSRENAIHYQLIYYCNISKHYSFFSFTRWLFPKRKIIYFFDMASKKKIPNSRLHLISTYSNLN